QVEERDLAAGNGMGRIYRIVPDGTPVMKARFNLAHETPAQLVGHLGAANSWWRDTAQRLLVEDGELSAVPALRALARSASSPALGRLHALWTLEGLHQLDRETVLAALAGTDLRVTTAAIRLSEKWLADPKDTEIFQRVLAASPGTSPRVILQKALSLGAADSPAALAALANLAVEHGQQSYVPDAIVSGLAGRELAFIRATLPLSNAAHASHTITLAASALLKSMDAKRAGELFALLTPGNSTPGWAQMAILAGVERFLPKTPEGKPVPGTLSAEPTSLIKLAAQTDSAAGKKAATLVHLLKWPGKPGMENETAAIAARLTPSQKALFAKGEKQFAAICAACHQPHGEGLSGLAPQLLYSRYVLGADRALIRIVLNGKENEGRTMPPLRSLDDDAIAGVLTYIRQSWGHNAPPVSPSTVTAVRSETAGREEPWTDEELQKFEK
ncbi:MAG: cytochrome c, partial [Lacunisphaera sp.]